MIARFGFGRPTGLPLQAETPGLVRKVAQWSARSKPTMAMGQELSVSAMQVLAAATAIANGGVLLKPLIVKKIVSPQGRVVKEFGREPLWEAVSPGYGAQNARLDGNGDRTGRNRAQGSGRGRKDLRQDGNRPGGKSADRDLLGE